MKFFLKFFVKVPSLRFTDNFSFKHVNCVNVCSFFVRGVCAVDDKSSKVNLSINPHEREQQGKSKMKKKSSYLQALTIDQREQKTSKEN